MSEEAIQDSWPHEGTFCWGCGKNNTHGLQLKSFWDEEETVASFVPNEQHLAFPGILNGGIIATIIDCHATGTANAAGHKREGKTATGHLMYVTGSLYVKFLKPTPVDKPVTLRAKVKEIKGNKITVTCTLYSEQTKCAIGEVVAFGVDSNKFLS
ncbi:MAG: PaaI family thioesterase [Candidatus Thorarchaeota archaeon]|jgi:acyl-coenzyme A thioesterase PaaI-like protein